MAEIIRFRKEFLPHLVRLFSPGLQKVDARLNYFQQVFALYQPAPEQSCLLLKGSDRLLACAYLALLEKSDLVYVNLAIDRGLSSEVWSDFWGQCIELAKTLVSNPPVLRIAIAGEVPDFILASGFQVVREQIELHATLGQLPPVQSGAEEFQVISLAQYPDQEGSWIDAFNHGRTVFWDMPSFDTASFQRLRNTPGFDGSAFRLGLEGGEAVTALFYSVLDKDLGLVRINAAATPSGKRSRGFGRRMIKETLNHLEKEGHREAIIYTDSANQATNLLFKMLGFIPKGNTKILESCVNGSFCPADTLGNNEAAAAKDSEGEANTSFFPSLHSAFGVKKPK